MSVIIYVGLHIFHWEFSTSKMSPK